MGISFKRQVVTPQMAKAWLKMNADNNRLPKQGRIPAYARDMRSGSWNSETGETIKFAEDDTLIDGQNRLMAVILADVPVAFDVAYGLPADAMLVIDSGKPRSAGDALKIEGVSERPRVAAIVRWVIQWDGGNFLGSGGRTVLVPTNAEIVERYRKDAGYFDSASTRASDCQRRNLSAGAVAGTAHVLFSRIDLEQTHQFFDQFISGANLPDRSAVLALRNRLARARVDRLTRAEQLALFVRSWNNFRAGVSMDRMVIAKGDLTNANFPQPK
jgi:hypothetical protein